MICLAVSMLKTSFIFLYLAIDQQKEFPQILIYLEITIKDLFENLPELRELKLRLSCNKVIRKPIFVKSDLEEIFEKQFLFCHINVFNGYM